jgi:putative PIN family toxin of toxin-antitoxin system
MRVLIDSNVLVSAIYAPNSVPHQAYKKAVESPYQGLICTFSLEELRRVFNRKLPQHIPHLERFLAETISVVEIVPIPSIAHTDEEEIRDVKDRPILRAAISAGAEILLTGDKDFLESGLQTPRMMTAAEFLKLP